MGADEAPAAVAIEEDRMGEMMTIPREEYQWLLPVAEEAEDAENAENAAAVATVQARLAAGELEADAVGAGGGRPG